MTPAQPVVDRTNTPAVIYDDSLVSLDEISLDEARTNRIEMRLAEFVVSVTECSSRRALSLILAACRNATPLQRLAGGNRGPHWLTFDLLNRLPRHQECRRHESSSQATPPDPPSLQSSNQSVRDRTSKPAGSDGSTVNDCAPRPSSVLVRPPIRPAPSPNLTQPTSTTPRTQFARRLSGRCRPLFEHAAPVLRSN